MCRSRERFQDLSSHKRIRYSRLCKTWVDVDALRIQPNSDYANDDGGRDNSKVCSNYRDVGFLRTVGGSE
ncbi:hypothetical protein BELL_0191g00040 [Botrytis elliptica]|uniref:Uncharacterized protein n=1 Tax=Botrytis elliptica TaxID=278938 RepID=A0A4Z1JX35_9HELO|nr:hypothetical protein BELL_0191g00040 [Botrytis elliptica]